MSTAINASRLGQMKARFQQKQMQEKEEKLTRLYETQQQRTLDRVVTSRTSSRNTTTVTRNNTMGYSSGETSPGALSSSGSSTISSQLGGGGRVRQMFEERRTHTKAAGIDKSYPLEPIKGARSSNVTFGKLSNTSNLLRRQSPTSNERLNAIAPRTQRRSEPIKVQQHHDKLSHSKSNVISSKVEKLPLQRSNTVQQQRKQQLGDGDSVKNSNDLKSSLRNSNANGRKVPAMNKVSSSPKKAMPTPVSTFKKSPTVTPKQSPLKSATTTSLKTDVKLVSSPSSNSPSKATRSNLNSASARRTLANSVSDDNLKPCKNCNRRFASDRLQKHEEICMKTANKKRKPYDALKHRVLGTEAEAFVAKPGKNSKSQTAAAATVKKNPPDWRRKHEEFIQAIRAAKQVQAHIAAGGNLRDLPPPPPSSNPDYVQCPHCGRKFNESAAERHIPKCANYSFNKPKTVVSKNGIKKR